MQSQDNQLSHSQQLCNLQNISYNQLDENSINKGNTNNKIEEKAHHTIQTKSMALELLKRIQMLQQKLDVLESKQIQSPRKKKKLRRKAKQIPRIYKCMFTNCGKQYGSEASLKNHHKIKHGIRLVRRFKPNHNKVCLPKDKIQKF